jgi:hypothetical protein
MVPMSNDHHNSYLDGVISMTLIYSSILKMVMKSRVVGA